MRKEFLQKFPVDVSPFCRHIITNNYKHVLPAPYKWFELTDSQSFPLQRDALPENGLPQCYITERFFNTRPKSGCRFDSSLFIQQTYSGFAIEPRLINLLTSKD